MKILHALIAMLLFMTTASAHDSWISQNRYTNSAGEWCCNAVDCKELGYTPKPVNGGVQLRDGEFIPMSEIMPLSPEGWMICRRPDGSRRCTFAPPNGS